MIYQILKMYKHRNAFIVINLIIFLISFIIIFARRPDILTNAQPWAEDGLVWMAEINNNGFWNTIFFPRDGYYQTISKLTYGFALLFGVWNAAFIANVVAIVLRCILILFILSRRLRFIDINYRLIVCMYLLFMPNIMEAYVNITNIHWYISIYMMGVLIAEPDDSRWWYIHDLIIVIISGLSGPFVAFFVPCLIIKRWHEHGSFTNILRNLNSFDLIMLTCLIVQVAAILISSEGTRSSAPLGASISLLAQIIQQRIIFGSFFEGTPVVFDGRSWVPIFLLLILIISIIKSALYNGWRYQILAFFPIFMIGFALAKPMISFTEIQWPLILNAGTGLIAGGRYFIVTNFFMFCHIIFLISRIGRFSQIASWLFFIILIPFFVSYFSIPPLSDVGYKDQMDIFKGLDEGGEMRININPPGWSINLIR